jgi:hypothetical protein
MIVKPTQLYGACGVMKFRSGELENEINKIDYKPIMVQEYIEGVDYHCTIVVASGRTLVRLTYIDRPEAKYFGCETDILADCEKIANHLGLNGIFNFDTRRAASGEVYFLECNPRPFLSMQMCAQGGINCFEAGIRAMDGIDFPPLTMETKTLRKARGIIQNALSPWKLSREDWGIVRDCLRDPVPFLHQVYELVSSRLSRQLPFAAPSKQISRIVDPLLAFAGSGVRGLFGASQHNKLKLKPIK